MARSGNVFMPKKESERSQRMKASQGAELSQSINLVLTALKNSIQARVNIEKTLGFRFFRNYVAPLLARHKKIETLVFTDFLANDEFNKAPALLTEAINVIADILQKNPRITTIILDGIFVSNKLAEALTQAFQASQIKSISMRGCTFQSAQGFATIMGSLNGNRKLDVTGSNSLDQVKHFEALNEWYQHMLEKGEFDFSLEQFCKFVDAESFDLNGEGDLDFLHLMQQGEQEFGEWEREFKRLDILDLENGGLEDNELAEYDPLDRQYKALEQAVAALNLNAKSSVLKAGQFSPTNASRSVSLKDNREEKKRSGEEKHISPRATR